MGSTMKASTLIVSLTALMGVMAVTAQTALPADGPRLRIVRTGGPSRPGPAEYFTGAARIDSEVAAEAPGRMAGARVSFEPGARTAWHAHPSGQILFVTAGRGRVQQWGGPVEEVQAGDTVWIPAGVKHWHGAAPDSAMTHIAISERIDGRNHEWMEHVSDHQYGAPPRAATAVDAPRPSQSAIGNIAPKLAQITDDVLYGDIWKRPELSRRDRSLVTVAALVALNRPEQLRSHLRIARQHGVTQAELIELITHLAFYAGWPNAVTAVSVAREVFGSEPAQ